ncbi:MAG: SUF system NifU family Fe-S cluster assembly protein [Nitrospirae bacterium]|nr:SUF system NifU family Fe-S cluster assembly protein [Nitrospirota bacterium]
MSELTDLYQEVILDHNKHPRNFGQIEAADHCAQGNNPLCGDQLKLYLKMDGDRVAEVRFEGQGCAISTASASILTEVVLGKTLAEVETLFESFHELLTGDPSVAAEVDPELGKLAVFAGVREFPVRVKCATLAWHTLKAAISDDNEVTTE